MTIRIIDGLEPVQIHHDGGKSMGEPLGTLELLIELLIEGAAIRQPGGDVGAGLAGDGLVQPGVVDRQGSLLGQQLQQA